MARRLALMVVGVGLLAACTAPDPAAPSATAMDAQADSAMVADARITGDWYVVVAWPLEAQLAATSRVGQRVRLGPEVLIDPEGRTCLEPRLTLGHAAAAAVLGGGRGFPPGDVAVATAFCGDALVGHYIATGGPALLTRSGGMLMRLERTPPAIATTLAATGQPGVYLASYSSRANALAGWKRFRQAAAAELRGASLRVMEAEVSGRGRFFRLYAAGVPARQQAALCRAVHRLSPDCGAQYR